MELTTLLFDLDGTLLPFDLDPFMTGYFQALLTRIGHLVDRDKIVKQIWTATHDMVRNENPESTNFDVFRNSFLESTGIVESDIWPIFDNFYETDFNKLRSLTNATDISREICRIAHQKGYRLVLATNPIFPETATRNRMIWAGIQDIPFNLVTTMEHMHFCKPNPKYYLEIMDMLGVLPEECMMFGNDVQEDGVAGNLGVQTYLVTNHVIDRNLGHVEFTHQGKLEDVLEFVKGLQKLTS